MISYPYLVAVLLLSFICVLCGSNALALSRKYDFGPIPLSDEANLFYNIETESSTAAFALVVNDSLIGTNSSNWIGIGISEPTSGSMLGADIVTAEFSPGQTTECEMTDRYVPFYAFPLIDSISDAPSAFPLPDDCQNDGSWTLVSCQRIAGKGQMIFEVERSLDAHDDQDRHIPPGPNSVIYAYGSAFAYHGSRRSSTRIILYEEDGTLDAGMDEKPLPDDVDGSIDVIATGYMVPNDKATTYACTSNVIRMEPGEKRMIVAAEPILNATVSAMVHHLTFWLCRGEEYARLTRNTVECTTGDSEIPGPQGSNLAQCATFIYAYVKGMKRLVLPLEAGILMDSSDYILVMETHYDNPDLLSDNIDFSGVRVFYTNTMRQYEAGSLLMGDTLLNRFDQTVQNGVQYEHSCTSACTKKFSRPINYFASFLHMHLTGMEIYTNKFSENGTFIENMNKVNFWSDSFQNYIVFDPPKQIRPGQQLQLTCLYDTRKRPNTTFGLETKNEMCMEFAGYWPVQRDPVTNEKINICALFEDLEQNTTGTVCGDSGNITESSIIVEPNPAFEDEIGAPTAFGTAQQICPTVEPVASLTTASPIMASVEPVASSTTASPIMASVEPVASSTTASPVMASVEPTTMPIVSQESTATDGEDNENAAPTEDGNNACFPASATVEMANGSKKRMDELQVGDSILVGHNEYSDVFMFTHRSANVWYPFVLLRTSSGKLLKLTRGHYVYLDGILKMADEAEIGDVVATGSGEKEVIVDIQLEKEAGLYNPQTIHGNVVVDGVVCSTFTRAVAPQLAHSLLAPLRLVHKLIDTSISIYYGEQQVVGV
eukprot:gb/GEZJ01000482.1/.p1 GENE.gb/GEZJ01000482.1/~~gb/GEZJ01000482.1/.p1  ORF type:complete len:829 (-),score=96.89 gb/GEZJ01000482.1/:2346-4832(-)